MFMKKKRRNGMDANFLEMTRLEKLRANPSIPEIEKAYLARMRDGAAARVDWRNVPSSLLPESVKVEETRQRWED